MTKGSTLGSQGLLVFEAAYESQIEAMDQVRKLSANPRLLIEVDRLAPNVWRVRARKVPRKVYGFRPH